MKHQKRGSVTLLLTLIAITIILAASTLVIKQYSPTGGAITVQTVKGPCNFTINDDIYNLGHDYNCTDNTSGFDFGDDNLTFDCQNHKIICSGASCKNESFNLSGITIDQHSGIQIQNCIFVNWYSGVEIKNASNNKLTLNHFKDNYYNVKIINGSESDYNYIWNNNFTDYNHSGWDDGITYWESEPNCNTTNIIGGPCLGGNFWDQYTGKDVDGDGLGDTPYSIKGGVEEDRHPLVDPNGTCPIVWNVDVNLIEDFQSEAGSGECFALVASDMVLDCQGHSLTGINGGKEDERGVEISGVHDVTVKNCLIHNFTYGIWVRNAHNINLINNTIFDNNYTGIYVGDFSENITIQGNTIKNENTNRQKYGIHLRSARPAPHAGNIVIDSNTINNDTEYGIYLSDNSDYNTISSNDIYSNNEGGIFISNSDATDIYNNKIHNHSSGEGIYVLNSTPGYVGNGTTSNTLYGNKYGYYFKSSTLPLLGLTGTIYNNKYGIFLSNLMSGTDHKIGQSLIYNSTDTGILIFNSDNVFIDYVNISNSAYSGIYASDSTNLTFSSEGDNYIYNNTYGIYFSNTNTSTLDTDDLNVLEVRNNTQNIVLINSYYNIFKWLTVYGGDTGFNLTNSSYNNISFNTISNFTNYNFYLNSSYNNTIFNNYIDNSTGGTPAHDDGSNNWSISKTDTIGGEDLNIIGGSYFGGNFWTAYSGKDVDGDGLGDTLIPYNGSGIKNGGDYHPLVPVNVSCGNISNNIVLNKNLTSNGTCFTVKTDNITLDCNNYLINGNNSGKGIYLNNKQGVTIKNCNVNNFSRGIDLYSGSDNTLNSNNVYNSNHGIYLFATSNNTIINNTMNNNYEGIYLFTTSNNTIINNNVYDNNEGIYFDKTSIHDKLMGNNIQGSNNGIYLGKNSNNSILINNKIYDNYIGLNITSPPTNNNTIYNNYFDNTNNVQDNGNNSWNTTYNCSSGSNIVGGPCLGGNAWSDYTGNDTNGDGIGDDLNYSIAGGSNYDYLPLVPRCGNVSNDLILNQNLTTNGTCFTITADNIEIDCNGYSIIGNNSGSAIYLSNKTSITIKNCNFENFEEGIYIDPSSDITINSTNVTGATYGIYFDQTSNSQVTNSRLYNNQYGLYLTNSNNNTFTTNYLYDNTQWGAYFTSSTNNTIYNNNFTNTHNAYSLNTNYWNTTYQNVTNIIGGPKLGGNFWSDYTGVDNGLGSYPYNATDTVGDTQIPYNFNITPGDYLPLTLNNGTIADVCPQTITEDKALSQNINCAATDGIIIAADDITLDCQHYIISGDGTGAGIYLNNRKNIIIKNCNLTNFYYGIEILNSDNIQINSSNYIYLNDFYGVYQFNSTNTKVTGNKIINDNNGIYSINSESTTITNNLIDLHKKFYGIYAFGSQTNTIENNNMTDNYHGIYLVNSGYTTITNNNITQSDVYSLFMHSGTANSHIRNNYLSAGQEAIRIKLNSNNNTFTNNTIFDHSGYGLHSTGSDANTFNNNTFTNNTQDVYLNNSASNTFTNNTLTQSITGLQAINSNFLALHLNTINSSSSPCLEVNSSSSANLTNNTFYNNAELNSAGSSIINYNTILTNLKIDNSPILTLKGNNITNNLNITNSNALTLSHNHLVYNYIANTDASTISDNALKTLKLVNFGTNGIISDNDVDDVNGTAFDFQDVDDSYIQGNNIQNATLAVLLYGQSDNNDLYDNWLKDNGFGLNVTNSTLNKIYNNYFENTNNVFDDSNNTWYTTYACGLPNIVGGPCQGGNFYSDYAGLDDGSNGRPQGDGIGDEPNYYPIASGNNDNYPLVLYVARQYFAPTNSPQTLTATGNLSGTLTDEQVVPAQVQTLTYSSNNKNYAQLIGLFNQSDVHAESLKINFNENKTAINKTGVTGIKNSYTLYLPFDGRLNAGLYLCPNIFNLSAVTPSCPGKINFTTFPSTKSGITASLENNAYKIENLTYQAVGAALDFTNLCGLTVSYNATLAQDINCSGTALTIGTNNIALDCNNYVLTGNSSGYGVYLNNKQGVTIKNCYIYNFSYGIWLDSSSNNTLTSNNMFNNTYYGIKLSSSSNNNLINNNLDNNQQGIVLVSSSSNNTLSRNHLYNNTVDGIDLSSSSNNALISNNISNSNYGIWLASSFNNTIYNNYFNNTNNALDNGNNFWNTTYNCSSGNNIIGESCLGGNYWSDYTGNDTNGDGIGDDLNYSISGGSNYDYLPLVHTYICGNNLKEGSEECDGSDFGGLSCSSYNYSYGSLSCTGSCTIDNSSCTNTPPTQTTGGGGGGGAPPSQPQCSDGIDNDGDGTIDFPEDISCSSLEDNDEADGHIVCTQSWSCSGWSECTNGKQNRTCVDQHYCLEKKTQGEINTIATRAKPDESRTCQVEVVYQPELPSPPPEEKPLPPPAVAKPEPLPVNTFLLSSAAIIIIFSSLFIYFEFVYPPARLRKKLRKTQQLLSEESTELLKEQYRGIYNLYLKLSQNKKQRYYSNLIKIREKIESQIKAEKQVERLLETASGLGNIQKQKHNYLKINELYKELPAKTQQKYYPKILRLRERLEKRT